ncbi:MAG: hypothetical protein KTR25_15900 [Myxococcales bacterium]|nr:hypothetical protein [Myxococcales bacterium]
MSSRDVCGEVLDQTVVLEEILSAFASRGSWPPVAITHSIAVDLLDDVADPDLGFTELTPRDVALGVSGQGQSQQPYGCQAIAKLLGELLGGDQHRSQLPAMARPVFAVLDDVAEGVLPPDPDRLRIALAQHLGPPAPYTEVANIVRAVGGEHLQSEPFVFVERSQDPDSTPLLVPELVSSADVELTPLPVAKPASSADVELTPVPAAEVVSSADAGSVAEPVSSADVEPAAESASSDLVERPLDVEYALAPLVVEGALDVDLGSSPDVTPVSPLVGPLSDVEPASALAGDPSHFDELAQPLLAEPAPDVEPTSPLVIESSFPLADDPVLPLAAEPAVPLAVETELPTLVPSRVEDGMEPAVDLLNQQLPELLDALDGADTRLVPTGDTEDESDAERYADMPIRPQVLRRMDPPTTDEMKTWNDASGLRRMGLPTNDEMKTWDDASGLRRMGPQTTEEMKTWNDASDLPRFVVSTDVEPITSALPHNAGVWEQAPSRRRAQEATKRSRPISTRLGAPTPSDAGPLQSDTPRAKSRLITGRPATSDSSSMSASDRVRRDSLSVSASDRARRDSSSVPPNDSARRNRSSVLPLSNHSPLDSSSVSPRRRTRRNSSSGLQSSNCQLSSSSVPPGDATQVSRSRPARIESLRTLEVSPKDPAGPSGQGERSAAASSSLRRRIVDHTSPQPPTAGTLRTISSKPVQGNRPVVRHEYSRTDRAVSVAAAPAARHTARAIRDGDSLLGTSERRGWTVWVMIVGIVGLAAYLVLS